MKVVCRKLVCAAFTP
ncbi:hypothetical protein QO219_21025 [Vibrio vulnificus]|nr:hypothetical protein [Vibrio vulnificus]MCU8177397.1 hypothetical protein [Vibrio vulnificus]MDK2683743.1 hypothetical protein [Vibrio vulnificus]MDS1810064.1 hypothetical protein [Vibrio vulnificus]